MAPETTDATATDPGPWLLSCGCMAFADGTRKACERHERITIEIKARGLVVVGAGRGTNG